VPIGLYWKVEKRLFDRPFLPSGLPNLERAWVDAGSKVSAVCKSGADRWVRHSKGRQLSSGPLVHWCDVITLLASLTSSTCKALNNQATEHSGDSRESFDTGPSDQGARRPLNELRTDPEINKRYQFWSSVIPAVIHFSNSAILLRQELDRIDPRLIPITRRWC
jgi:hypothetical protein